MLQESTSLQSPYEKVISWATPSPFISVKPSSISNEVLRKIFEIEQDMWSRGIGEYLKCTNCDSIFSKSDIYGKDWHIHVPDEIRLETVMEIEKHLCGILPCCNNCGWATEHIYNQDEYVPAMVRRYRKEESFLTLAHDDWGEIIGFMDWYIATLWEIFEEELGFHYTHDILNALQREYHMFRDQKFLTFASIGTNDRNKSLNIVLWLLQTFFNNMDSKHDKTLSIFESIIGSSTYCIFNIMWAIPMEVYKKPELCLPHSQNPLFPTDILIQPDMVSTYKNNFSVRTRDIVVYSKKLKQKQVHETGGVYT